MKIKSIKELREALNMTQVQFAKALKAQQANVSSWEHGRWNPSAVIIARMVKLAQKQGVKVNFEDLMGE